MPRILECPMQTNLSFSDTAPSLKGAKAMMVVGRLSQLKDDTTASLLPKSAKKIWPTMLEALKPGDNGASTSTWLAASGVKRLIAVALPEPCSRHNSPARPHAIAQLVRSNIPSKDDVVVVVALEKAAYGFASGCAVARAFSDYTRSSGAAKKKSKRKGNTSRQVRVGLVAAKGKIDTDAITRAADGIHFAARLVDMPASELSTDAFVAEAQAVAERNEGVEIEIIRGKALDEGGFGGLWGVGKSGPKPPALVRLSYSPPRAKKTTAWVGKGIVYDTGGLSIKTKAGMVGMKMDMGGAAAVIAGFEAAVRGGIKVRLHALLCLAENSVGPEAMRPDDVLDMYSGKTVEVNNTDAEGRLVLADGVAYASKVLGADLIVDLATLTGAQLMATGRRHAGVMCNDEKLEAAVVKAGKESGDLVHPLPYCPEFFRGEFKSKIADMKNSVKDRMNAQTSCAGQFIGNHLEGYKGRWLHVDMAGPAMSAGRATGYGVALLMSLVNR